MLCMSRRAAGKPALAIAWGPVDHVGYVAEILKVCILLPHCLQCAILLLQYCNITCKPGWNDGLKGGMHCCRGS